MKHYFSHDFFLYMYMYLESFSYIMMYAENINWLICMCSFRWNVYLYVTFLPHYRSFVSTILAITDTVLCPCCLGIGRTDFQCLHSQFKPPFRHVRFHIVPHLQVRMALNHIDAAVESFKQALELEPNDGLCITLSSSLVINLLFTTETTGFCL